MLFSVLRYRQPLAFPDHLDRLFGAPWMPFNQRAYANDNTNKKKTEQAETEPEDAYHLSVPTEEDMVKLGKSLACLKGVPSSGDVMFLFGELGVGKTVLARALIRSMSCDPELTVPSPSYLLSQVYQILKISEDPEERDDMLEVHHLDMYRLQDAAAK